MSNYTNDILLAVFFKEETNTSNLLFVSFDGLNFYEIETAFSDGGGHDSRDPSLFYHNGKIWVINSPYGNNIRGKQPRWGYSINLNTDWSIFTDGGVAITANSNKPYDQHGNETNTDFDAVASEIFADGNDIWLVTSLGFVGQWHNLTPWQDTMRPYLTKVTTLTSDNNYSTPSISYNDAIPVKVNSNIITDERGDKRIHDNTSNNPEDRIDGFLYKENGTYYLVVKRYGDTNEIWSIGSLSNVSNPNSWTLVNSDFLYGYEGACLVKFRGKYLVYADKMSGDPIGSGDTTMGMHVTTCGTNGFSGLWKNPTRVCFKHRVGGNTVDYTEPNFGRHGSVMVVSAGTSLHTKIMQRFDSHGYTAPGNTTQPWQLDMDNGWFRSNGKRYFKNNGNLKSSCEYFDGSHWYWFDSDGTLARNKDVYIPGQDKWVHYDEKGWMVYGDKELGPQWYYDPYYSDMNKHWYYFEPGTGKMAHGYIEVDGIPRYYDEVTGWRIW